MSEVWLRPNRRVLFLASLPVCAVGLVGAALIDLQSGWFLRAVGGLLLGLSVCSLVMLCLQIFRPRVSFRDGRVGFHLGRLRPIEVPLEHVEAFFLGQGPSGVPEAPGKEGEAVNLIARLSQKAPEWASRDVKPSLGRWCDGYVTIRGAWCEPLSNATVGRLNRRLAELARAAKASDAGGEGLT